MRGLEMRIGVFGGTFDPVHMGHLVMAQEAMTRLDLSRVLFVPSLKPPHKPDGHITEARHRVSMLRLATAGCRGFGISDVEIRRRGVSYTIDTIRQIRRRLGSGTEVFFILGADSLRDLPTWKDHLSLVKLCRVVPYVRDGFDARDWAAMGKVFPASVVAGFRKRWIDGPAVGVSSSAIRERLAGGGPIRFLVPPAVEGYIRRHRLYVRR
jgi:nicotinate-nucleotide adenylyltransferase